MAMDAKPAGTSGGTIVLVIFALILVPVILIGGCCIGCVGCQANFGASADSHPLVLQSQEIVKKDPLVRETFGEVTDVEFKIIRKTGGLGDYGEFTYGIETTDAAGEVVVNGSRSDGETWIVEEITVSVVDGETIDVDVSTSLADTEEPPEDGLETPADDGPAPFGDGLEPADDGLEPEDDGLEPEDDTATADDAVAEDAGEESP